MAWEYFVIRSSWEKSVLIFSGMHEILKENTYTYAPP